MVHDISNTLTVIVGWLAEARAPDASAETLRYALNMAETQAQIARDVARRAIDANNGVLIEAEKPWRQLVEECVAALSVESARKRVKLQVEGETLAVPILWPLDASQVITNILLNALAYSPIGSTVRLQVDSTPELVRLDVSDEGPGVPPERRQSIFEGDSTRDGGAGVGLSHSRQVAERRGGDVELLSSPKGASFRVTWPRGDFIPPPPPSAPRPQLLAGMRVLVVEDDAAIIQLLESILDARGATVSVARTLAEVENLKGGPHDAVLTDLSPIAADVPRALATLRQCSPGARFVVITGSTDSLPNELSTPDVRVVKKPFAVGEVLDAILESNDEM